MMRCLPGVLCTLVAAALLPPPGAAETPAPETPAPAARATTPEIVEDLRILSLVNGLEPTRDQTTRLAGVAEAGAEGLARIHAEVKTKVDQLREPLTAARKRLLRGEDAEPATTTRLSQTTQSAEAIRAQKIEALIHTLTERVRRILTPEQAARIETDLAPTGDQPWRRFGRVLSGPGGAPPRGSRMPSDPGKWLGELRDLRIDSAEGDPQHEVEDFAKKMTRGLKSATPLFEQSAAQARAFATQVLAMPPNVFKQREWVLARMVSKQELDTRNQQRVLEGKAIEVFDPYRWFVEEIMLSPRAPGVLRERAALR